MLKTINQNEPKLLETFLPKKDFVLLTGKIEVLGVELFCGSLVIEDEKGLNFSSCKTLTPDPILMNKLKDKKVGDILFIDRTRNKDAKLFKNQFTVDDVKIIPPSKEQAESYEKSIKAQLHTFDEDFYKENNIII